MNDMSSVIVPKSDQINADDFITGPQTITINKVVITGGQEQPVSIYFDGSEKAFRPCKSMSRVLVHAWGPDAKVYVGRSLTLYRDPSVKWGGLEVGGIRISHMSHIEGKMQMQLTATKGQRRPHVVLPLASVDVSHGKNTVTYDFLAGIAACPTAAHLRQWWKDHGDAIPDASYDRVFAAFNERLSSFKSPRPAATAPGEAPTQEAESAAALASQPGRGEEDMGEAVTLESAKAEIDAAELVGDVNNRLAALREHLSDDEGDELVTYAGARIDALKGVAS